jgi:hypothetical protein
MPKISASQGRPCSVWLELAPAIGAVVPPGFTFYIEWLGPDGETEFLLKTREAAATLQEGNKVCLEVDVPRETPVGLYEPAHFEMRHGGGNQREVREESVDGVPLPSIQVSEAIHPEVPWPKVKSSS